MPIQMLGMACVDGALPERCGCGWRVDQGSRFDEIRDDQRFYCQFLDWLDGWSGQNTLGDLGVNLDRSACNPHFGGLAYRASRVKNVTNNDAGFARNRADGSHLTRLLAPLVANGQRCFDPLGPFPRHP